MHRRTRPDPPPGVTGYLSADHRRLDGLFADAVAHASAGRLPDARVAFGQFVDGLKRHIAIEESIVFPLFDRRTGIVGPLTVMLREHRSLEQLLGRARHALDQGDALAFAREAGAIGELLQAHNLKEERILYPRTDAALDESERVELVAQMERS